MSINNDRGRPPTADKTPSTFGAWLKAERVRRGWSSERMSEELGLSQGAVSLYERGARHPRREKVVQFALALGVNPQEALDALIADTPGLEATPPPNPAIEALAARLASLSAEDQQYILSLIERLLQSPTRQE